MEKSLIETLKEDYAEQGYDLFQELYSDRELKEDTLHFLQETDGGFDQIMFGAVGLGMSLLIRLYPEHESEDNGFLRGYMAEFYGQWVEGIWFTDKMTAIIDSALERARTKIDKGGI